MKKRFSFLLTPIILFVLSGNSFGQKNDIRSNTYIEHGIQVDGDLKEWGDSLKYYDPATKLHYNVGNDKQNLYVAIQISDPSAIRKILSFGFSFALNIETKKKTSPTLTFPLIDHQALRSALPRNQSNKPVLDESKLNRQIISKIKGIHVEHFSEILDGDVALNNEYGLKAAALLDDKNTLNMELAIPLSLFGLNIDYKEALAYNFKINGLQRTVIQQGPMRGVGGYGGYGGYGNYGYGNRETYRKTISESVEFWTKFKLAQP